MAIFAANSGLDVGGTDDADTTYNPAHSYSVQHVHDQFATHGDTITLPSGTFTWSQGTLLSKTVTIQGNNYTPNTNTNFSGTGPGAPTLNTTISTTSKPSTHPYAIGINLPTGTGFIFRITGITFSGLPNNTFSQVVISGAATVDAFRVDNCLFTSSNQVIFVAVTGGSSGAPWGLFDHCTFNGGGGSEMVHPSGYGAGNLGGWTVDVTPGGEKMLYFEDCIFQMNGYATATGQGSMLAVATDFGALLVARYNLMNFALFDCHGNTDSNTRWFEIYNNQVFVPSTNTGNTDLCDLRGGSGVVYNNSLAPNCQTSHTISIRFFTDQAQPPNGAAGPSGTTLSPQIAGPAPEYGPGAGIFSSSATSQGPTSSPVYIWGNDTHIGVVVSLSTVANPWNPSPITANSNYFVSTTQPSSMTISQKASQIPPTTYSYSPFTYPHPFTGLANVPGDGITAATDLTLTKTIIGISIGSGAYNPPANNYFACYSSEFTNNAKAGATEWSATSNPAYVRVPMGANGSGWSIAAYSSGVGVVWSNLNGVICPAVQSNAQTLWSLGWCDALTAGNINFFIDLTGALTVDIGLSVVLPPATGAVFTTY